MSDAYRKENILHKDISINNIMLTVSNVGLLNDWDMAGHADMGEGHMRVRVMHYTQW